MGEARREGSGSGGFGVLLADTARSDSTRAATRRVRRPEDVPPPPPSGDCNPCDGKVTLLTLRYDGPDAEITVGGKKADDPLIIDPRSVADGGEFTLVGNDKHGTLGTEIRLFVGNAEAARIHTSCSQPIGPGMVFGPFTVIEGYSKNGGLLCPQSSAPVSDDKRGKRGKH